MTDMIGMIGMTDMTDSYLLPNQQIQHYTEERTDPPVPLALRCLTWHNSACSSLHQLFWSTLSSDHS